MEAINVLARLVLTALLVVIHNWFILYFCTVVITPFLNRLIFPDKLAYSDSVEAIQPCHDIQQLNCDRIIMSASYVLFTVIECENKVFCFDMQLVFSHLSFQTFSLVGCSLVTLQ